MNQIHTLVYPLLREMIAARDSQRAMGALVALRRDVINVVWHIRTESALYLYAYLLYA